LEGVRLYNIQLIVNDVTEKEMLSAWIDEEYHPDSYSGQALNFDPANDWQILVVEISKLLDWVFIHRLKKQKKNLLVLPIVSEPLIHTVPLTMRLKLPYFFIKPLKKKFFIRTLKQALEQEKCLCGHNGKKQMLVEAEIKNNEALQELFLRRLLRGDVTSEQEIIDSRLFDFDHSIPNTVCFIQGFVRDARREQEEGWLAPEVIRRTMRQMLEKVAGKIFFVPYRKHLLMLLKVPAAYVSPRFWKEGEEMILMAIDTLKEKYGIYLYIGVGSIYSEPLLLHRSYIEAKSARRTPPYNRLVLRYFEETAKDAQIKKSIEYIATHYADEITCTKVAAHINFSPAYFSRLFKKETGRSYVEYVTFVRLKRASALLRHSDNTIEQIAEELGFNTPNYFSNIFKKYIGLTPSEFRATKEILFY
jgi:two-component system response regulator YesN